MEVDVATLSDKGQIVIPAAIRRESHLEPSDQFLVFGKGDTILLKKIDESVLERSFDEITAPLRERAAELGLDQGDVEEIVHDARAETSST